MVDELKVYQLQTKALLLDAVTYVLNFQNNVSLRFLNFLQIFSLILTDSY